ncbi:hypothetical protein [Pseudonocardia nigra]|nr:hypothetical protein [Pseudonocardia nigra]
MPSTALHPQLVRPADEASMTHNLRPDLELFWPSRRGHAYDEFCRS